MEMENYIAGRFDTFPSGKKCFFSKNHYAGE